MCKFTLAVTCSELFITIEMYCFPKQGREQTFVEKGEFTSPCLCSPLIFD